MNYEIANEIVMQKMGLTVILKEVYQGQRGRISCFL